MNDLIGLVTDLSTRLAQVERLLERQNTLETPIGGSGNRESGTSFPSSPSDGDPFWRTDHNLEYFYDSGHGEWLTAMEYQASPVPWETPPPYDRVPDQLLSPLLPGVQHVVTRFAVLMATIGPAGGTDYYTVSLRSASTIVASYSTPTPSKTFNYYWSGTPNMLLPLNATDFLRFRLDAKVGVPGVLRLSGNFWYRLVG